MSILVSFEGPDAVGKETQAKKLCAHYNSVGINAVYCEFPLNDDSVLLSTSSFRLIKNMLSSGFANRYPTIFQIIQFANKFFFNILTLPKLLNAYDVVILDRWSASVLVYGLSTGVKTGVVNKMFKSLRHADVTIILNGESFNKKNKDSYEKDDDLQSRVKKYYTKYQNDYINKKNILSINPTQGIDVIHKLIIEYIKKHTK